MSLLLALLAQIGPFPQSGTRPVSPLPPEILERKRTESQRQAVAPALPPLQHSASLSACLAVAKDDPSTAAENAELWLARAEGVERSEAGQCLGMALVQLEQWDEAEATFLAARATADPDGHDRRARLAAMAGNAAMARGDGEAALAAFETAQDEAGASGSRLLAGDIAIDRSRALVALDRLEAARDALGEARSANPGNPQGWLLSATLSRRLDDLAMAQVQIEEAAKLMPIDPEIGLEAGVIAVLAGNEEAARKSWQSVIDAAPDSDAAGTARDYLAQLGQQDTPQP